MADERLYLELGYASVHAYAEAELELTSRHSADLVRIGRRLPDLPAIDAAFARGDIGWTKAREIVGVATPATEAAWLQRAVDLSSRDLERHVASAQGGEPPAEEDVLKAPSRVRLVIELDAQDAEVLQAALAVLRSGAGVSREEIDDGALIAEMARRTVHDAEPGEAPTAERYRTVLEHCPRCRHTSGVESEVNDTHVGLASCDGEVVEMRPGPKRGHLAHAIPPSMRRVVMHRDRHRCALCIVRHRVVHAGLLAVRAVDDGFEFEFRDGRVARSLPRERTIEAHPE